MELFELAEKRYSVRKFDSKPVEKEKLQSILEFSRLAPSAKNLQPHKMLVLEEAENLVKLNKTAKMYSAPLAIIVCADREQSWKRPYDDMDSGEIDATIITTYMLLEATRQGLGTIWVCYFDPDKLREEFKLPDHIVPVNILGIGYPAPDAAPAKLHYSRKALEETVYYESYNW